jgi:hypothetical protein
MLSYADSVEVLILGNSHAYFGINPAIISLRSFNLANSGELLKYSNYLLKHYSDNYKCLKMVILSVSYQYMFIGDDRSKDKHVSAINYKVFMDFPYYSDFSQYNWFISEPSFCVGTIGDLLAKRTYMSCDSLGYVKDNLLSERRAKFDSLTSEKHARAHYVPNRGEYTAENLRMIKEMALFCEEHSIHFFLITTPVWGAYSEKLDVNQLNEMYEILNSLQHEYKIPYYDYSNDARFTNDDFYDTNHLSNVGAEKFTKIVNTEILHLE